MGKQALLNTYINNVTMPETIAAIEQMIVDDKKSYVVAINVDVVMKIENDSYLKQVVDNADMVLVDGKPLVWISKLHGRPLKAKISGSDLVPLLCEVAAQKKYTIFIIGGKEGVAEQAKRKLEAKLPGIQIVGTYAPPFGFEKDEKELASCYTNCLALAAKKGIKSVAFCCISTGEFHFPNETAAHIAIKTVRNFLKANKDIKVIFNVFLQKDLDIYRRIFGING